MKLTDRELIAALESEEARAVDSTTGELAQQRADALARYRGAPLGNEVEGRSQVVDRSIMDTIEWIMPSLVRIYLGGDDIGKFEPIGPEDEEAAKTETDVCNWYLEAKNDLFAVINAALRDALLLKNGYIVGNWEKHVDTLTETYIGKTEEEVALLMQDPEVQIIEQTPREDPMYGVVYDLKLEMKKAEEYVGIEAVPPDEMLVSKRHRNTSLLNADFVEHVRRNVTIGELRAQGFSIDDDEPGDDPITLEETSRDRFGRTFDRDDETKDPSRRVVTFRDAYIRIDLQGRGTPQLWRIARVDGSKKIVLKDEANIIPFAAQSPILYPHSHIGTSVYDLIADLGIIKTALERQALDGVYLQNSGRMGIDVNRVVNLDDLLVSRPGGVVRFDGNPNECMAPITSADASGSILGLLEFVEAQKEGRTGVTRYSAGLDSNTLNKTATGIQAIQSAANQRIEMIARTLASGFKDLFLIVHALASKHCTKALQIKLKGKWVQVDPRQWKKRTDFSISVGMGTGTPEQQMQKLLALQPLLQGGMQMGLVGPMEVYNFSAEVLKAAGYKLPDKFIHAPPMAPKMGPDGQPVMGADGQPVMEPQVPPPQKDPIVQAQEIKTQGELQGKQLEWQSKPMEAQIELQKSSRDAEMKLAIASKEGDIKVAIARMEAEIEAQTKLQVAQIEIAAKERIEITKARLQALTAGVEDPEAPEVQDRKRAEDERVSRRDKVNEGLANAMLQVAHHLSRPKRVVRGPDGRVAGVE